MMTKKIKIQTKVFSANEFVMQSVKSVADNILWYTRAKFFHNYLKREAFVLTVE